MLVGRRVEAKAIDDLIARVRGGRGAALVIRGGTGIGKTALLEYAIQSASDFQIASTVGIESEMQLGFGGVHQLVRGFDEHIDELPSPQRDAIRSAFGIVQTTRPDRFMVGLAVLTMLAEAASQRPLLCVIDDAHWLDRASAEILGFVARRLVAERVAIVLATRKETPGDDELQGVPTLHVEEMSSFEARELLSHAVQGRMDGHVVERLIETASGNPLALIELASDLTPAQLQGSARLPEPLPIGARLQDIFQRRVTSLPTGTRTMLLLAAAEPSGDPALLLRGAKHLGLGIRALEPAEQNRLITIGTQVTFRHPLIRSAAYYSAPHSRRKLVHEALAAASDPILDPDRRAWHRAAALLAPDDEVAAELEVAADRALARGGYAAAGAFLERSAELTTDEALRANRLLAAAQAELAAGDAGKTQALLSQVKPRLAGPTATARALRLRAMTDYVKGQLGEVASLLVEAARTFASVNVTQARETLLEAIQAAAYSARFARAMDVKKVAAVAREVAPPRSDDASIVDGLLAGYTSLLLDDRAAAAPHFRRALASFQDAAKQPDHRRWFMLGCLAASEIWDDNAQYALASQWVGLSRDTGALVSLAIALNYLGWYEVMEGRPRAAAGLLAEGREIAKAIGNASIVGDSGAGILLRLVLIGNEDEARAAADAMVADGVQRQQGASITHARSALTLLELSLGNYEAALVHGREVYDEDLLYPGTLVLPDLVEAGMRGGDPDFAGLALDRLRARVEATPSEWAQGLLARSEALVASGERPDAFFTSAIRHLEQCRIAPDLARTHLLYGEWLRRQGRRRDARTELRLAHEMFESMGFALFAERARIELNATGEHARRRGFDTLDQLTPQEAQISRLAGEGARNQEIAAQLFISPATVEYHLTKVFRKLGVSSRTQLARVITTDSLQPLTAR